MAQFNSRFNPNVSTIIDTVTSWHGITPHDHRFGGVQFDLGTREVGHIHSHGMIDIPFSRELRNVLISENKAAVHHLLTDSGWITYMMRTPEQVAGGLWLYRLSYLRHVQLLQNRGRAPESVAGLDIAQELAALQPSLAIQAAFPDNTHAELAEDQAENQAE